MTNLDYYWGFTENTLDNTTNLSNKNPKKRTFSDFSNSEKHQIYDPLIYTFGKEVHFSAGIDKLTVEILIKHLSAVIFEFYDDYESRGEELVVTYVVDSPGGSVLSVLKFVDFIKLSKSKHPLLKFRSIISGLAASAGTIMACVADERLMTTNAKSMIHDLSGNIPGTYTQMVSQFEFIKDLNNSLVNIYLGRCKKTKEELTELLMTNKWFNANQYLEFGFVDKVV